MRTVTRIGGNLGARVEGIDFGTELNTQDLEFLTEALFEHQVISLAAMDMSAEQHQQIASCFGELEHQATDQFSVDENCPFLTVIDSDNGDRADSWHADETFLQHPPLVNLLHAKIVPSHGGDTAFISAAAAYEALSDKMQELLSGLTAMHDYGHLYELGWRSGIPLAELVADALAKGLLYAHPVVRSHRATGRKWLTVNPTYTRFIQGLPPLEAKCIQELLLAHMQKPEFAFRHHWQVGDLLIWDQEAVQHYAVGDYQGRRLMHRISALASTDTYVGVKSA